jgi:hypothetical protein
MTHYRPDWRPCLHFLAPKRHAHRATLSPPRPRHSHTRTLAYSLQEPPMTPSIHIYDTTLRDGAQREGISYSLNDNWRLKVLPWRAQRPP